MVQSLQFDLQVGIKNVWNAFLVQYILSHLVNINFKARHLTQIFIDKVQVRLRVFELGVTSYLGLRFDGSEVCALKLADLVARLNTVLDTLNSQLQAGA